MNKVWLGMMALVLSAAVQAGGQDMHGNVASSSSGVIEGDAQIQGVTIINDQVWIDGERVPASATRYRTRSGRDYRILRSPTGDIEVREQQRNARGVQ